jgi:hypothetical protein
VHYLIRGVNFKIELTLDERLDPKKL